LWVGFVAPESIATEETAAKVASRLGIKGQPSVAQIAAAPGVGEAARLPNPVRIIGLVYNPRAER
jgi:hypothetical protein